MVSTINQFFDRDLDDDQPDTTASRIQNPTWWGTWVPPKNYPAMWMEVKVESKPFLITSRAQYDAIMFGDEVCPYCNNTDIEKVEREWSDGSCRRKLFDEKCHITQRRQYLMGYLKHLLPERYMRSNLWTLKPSPESNLSLTNQQFIIDLMKKEPTFSYFFFGQPGTSKTTFTTALIRAALERNWSKLVGGSGVKPYWIHYINWSRYIQSLMDWQNHPDTADEPALTPERILKWKRQGHTPVIAIEEIDKSRLTEYKANQLFELVDALDATEGQLIMTTNFRFVEEFQAWLYQADNSTNLAGEATWRRITRCKIIDCKGK
jgi:DNA replication protein DnaC